jgi:hypothetical protein
MSPEFEARIKNKFPSMFGSMIWPTFDCGDGWQNLLESLCNDLYRICPDVEVLQVKEKFGTLRFYVQNCTDEGYGRISGAETLSETTCEECGALGRLRSRRGWLFTRCNECWEKMNGPVTN